MDIVIQAQTKAVSNHQASSAQDTEKRRKT